VSKIPKVSSIVKKSIAQSVADKIKTAILTGNLKPGERLKEQDLCDELNVSRTPLREAYRILQSQALIEYNPYQGVFVAELTEKYIRELWFIKCLLEPEAAALAARHITESGIAQMEEILDDAEVSNLITPYDFVMYDNKFHGAIAANSGNEELHKIIVQSYESTLLPRSRTVIKNRTILSSHEEHKRIFSAIRNGDIEAARKHTLEQLDAGLDAVLLTLEK